MAGLLISEAHVFERGDRIYLTTPVQRFTPSPDRIEEMAFASTVKKQAPNENLMWLNGQYVEAERPNLNGATWRQGELAMKSLTPLLMPVTVMHDPSTAVGTIADAALMTPEKDKVARARIDTILALWNHRFPAVCEEAQHNLDAGTLMQSMECLSPWYECSACSQVFYKLPNRAERASWCDHLKAAEAAGYVADHQTQAWRILGDVCFTGTGLIFGTRGATGAYTEAHLSQFQDEVAEFHARVHTDTSSVRSHRMSLVQIEQSELDTLRTERDDARTEAAAAVTKKQEAERATETAEAAKVAAEKERDDAKAEATKLEETASKQKLAKGRLDTLGAGFTAKLGDFTKSRLEEQAASLSDEEWDNRLKECEELAQVKRDAKGDGKPPPAKEEEAGGEGPTFPSEEVARFAMGGEGGAAPAATGAGQSAVVRRSVAAGLAKAFSPPPAKK